MLASPMSSSPAGRVTLSVQKQYFRAFMRGLLCGSSRYVTSSSAGIVSEGDAPQRVTLSMMQLTIPALLTE